LNISLNKLFRWSIKYLDWIRNDTIRIAVSK